MNDVLSIRGKELNLENIKGIVLQTGGKGMLILEAVLPFMTSEVTQHHFHYALLIRSKSLREWN